MCLNKKRLLLHTYFLRQTSCEHGNAVFSELQSELTAETGITARDEYRLILQVADGNQFPDVPQNIVERD